MELLHGCLQDMCEPEYLKCTSEKALSLGADGVLTVRERPAKRALTPCDRSAADWSKACGFFEANPEATVVLTTQAHAARKRICDIDACFFRNYFICLCHMSCITCMYVCVYVCMYVCRHVVSSYILMEVSK